MTASGLSLPFATRPNSSVPFHDIAHVVADAVAMDGMPGFDFVHELTMGIPIGAQEWMSESNTTSPSRSLLNPPLTDHRPLLDTNRSKGGDPVVDQAEDLAVALGPAQDRPGQPDRRGPGAPGRAASDHARGRQGQGRGTHVPVHVHLGPQAGLTKPGRVGQGAGRRARGAGNSGGLRCFIADESSMMQLRLRSRSADPRRLAWKSAQPGSCPL